MSNVARKAWTAEQFLEWAERQDGRFEFDGAQPVGMVGGTLDHDRITTNIFAALRSRLRGTGCSFFGSDVAVTAGTSVRFPDALITCGDIRGTDRVAPDVCVVFEVISPSTASTDRIAKVRDYAAVPTNHAVCHAGDPLPRPPCLPSLSGIRLLDGDHADRSRHARASRGGYRTSRFRVVRGCRVRNRTRIAATHSRTSAPSRPPARSARHRDSASSPRSHTSCPRPGGGSPRHAPWECPAARG